MVRRVRARRRPRTSGTGTGGGRRGRAWPPATRAPSRRTGARSSRGRRGSSTRPAASTSCTCSRAASPTSTGSSRTSARAVYSMMNWWLDRGVDGFRMDVIDMISKDTALPDGPVLGSAPFGDGSRAFLVGPRNHEFVQEMHREVFARRDGRTMTVGEMPGVTIEDGRLFTDPARGEVDMVFQFEHVNVDQGARQVGSPAARPAGPQGDARAVAGRPRRRRVEQPVLVQPRPAAHRVALGRRRRAPRAVGDDAGHRPPPPSRDAVRVPGRGARDDQRGVRLDRGVPRHRGPQPLRRGRRSGPDPAAVLAAMGPMHRDNARTPMQWDDRPNAGFTTGTPWIAVNPNHVAINAAAARADDGSVFHHYRRLIELRHTIPSSSTATFDDAARRRPPRLHVHPHARRRGAARARPTSPATSRRSSGSTTGPTPRS